MSTYDRLFDILLSQPPGRYGLTPFGQTYAVTLTGSEQFQEMGHNLFANAGGRLSAPPPPIHRAVDRFDGVFFCLPMARIQLSLALFFNAHLVRANLRDVVDDEGDFVEVACDREVELWAEAEQLACDFIVNHMRPDWRSLPTYEGEVHLPVEHEMGQPGAAHESE